MRPEVRIIQDQEEEIRDVSISEYEKNQLLSRYGYGTTQHQIPNNNWGNSNLVDSNLTFEELCRREEIKREEEMKRRRGPKPTTFDSNNYYSSNKYSSDSGIGFSINIVSDIPLD
jgi:hypothetical protein